MSDVAVLTAGRPGTASAALEEPTASVVRATAVFSGGGTGGHLYPALALADALRERRPDVRVFFVGARRGIEARVLPERGVEHALLPIEGARRGAVFANVRVARALVSSLARVAALFHQLRPSLVVVTGGYAGAPAGIVAGAMRISLVLQEQNSVPGMTTRLLSRWAREVHLAFPEAVPALPAGARQRARVTGNPVRPPVTRARAEAAAGFGVDPGARIVLVVGGSQGARALNDAVLGAIAGVADGSLGRPDRLQLLWATGPSHLEGIRGALERFGNPMWVRAQGYIDEMPDALALADLAVSRAGAMATSEFLAWGIPSILVPFPSAAADHQARNAEALESAGAAVHLPETGLTPASLWTRVTGLVDDDGARRTMAAAARVRGRPDAAREIAEALDAYLPPAPRPPGAPGSAPGGPR